MRKIIEKIKKILCRKGWTLALAESCTGGLVSHWVTDIPGSSEIYRGGVVAYHNSAKKNLLGVPRTTLRRAGAVSAEAARDMAKGCKKRFASDCAVAITGIAGPSGGTLQKPVGLVFICVLTPRRMLCIQRRFRGSRARIKKSAASAALSYLLRELN